MPNPEPRSTRLGPRSRPTHRPVRQRVGAAVLGLALVACSSSSSDGSDADRTTTTGRPTTTAAPTTTTSTMPTPSTTPLPRGADPTADDIADEAFSGLGDPRIDVLSYDVRVRADPGTPAITGQVRIRLVPRTDTPLRAFTLDLRGPTITTATIDGSPATVTADPDGDQVELTPATPLAVGRTVLVDLRYTGVPRASDFPLGAADVGWQQDQAGGWFTMAEPDGTSTWVPVNDHPSDKATWVITLDTPKGVTGVANGRLASSTTRNGRTAWRWEMNRPIVSYTVIAAVGDYRLTTRTGPSGRTITVAVATAYPKTVDASFAAIDDILDYFTDTFGPYPYDDAGAIVVDAELGLALETTTRPLFGTEATYSDEIWALAHELAHQWWGDSVSLTTWRDLWLNEGFATYSDWLYQDHTGTQPLADSIRFAEGVDREPVTSASAARGFTGAVYQGGALALQALRHQIGDDAFFETLRTWYRDHRDANATTDEFVATAARVSGQDVSEWRHTWLDSAPQPARP